MSTLAYQRVPEEEVIHMKQWLHSKDGLGDYNLCLCFMNSTYETAQENLKKRAGKNLEEVEKIEELQRRALNRYRMAIHREVFDFDCLLKITPNILPFSLVVSFIVRAFNLSLCLIYLFTVIGICIHRGIFSGLP